MNILKKMELLKGQENKFVKDKDNQYNITLKEYGEMIQRGITKPRGYCLSSIVDCTDIVYLSENLSNN